MIIIEFKTLPSTQSYLLDEIKKGKIKEEKCVCTRIQSAGLGSRGNTWDGDDLGLYFSFCVYKNNLPKDLKLQSASIFFGFIFKEILKSFGSKAWLKWPNDLYLNENKIGGVMCNIDKEFVVCGIGLNVNSSKFCNVESGVITNNRLILDAYFNLIIKYSWMEVFEKYSLEFDKSKKFMFHHNEESFSLIDSKLLEDGSISLNNNILYCNR